MINPPFPLKWADIPAHLIPGYLRQLAGEIESGKEQVARVLVILDEGEEADDAGVTFKAFGKAPFTPFHGVGLCSAVSYLILSDMTIEHDKS